MGADALSWKFSGCLSAVPQPHRPRHMFCEMLTRGGYDVVTAPSVDEALDLVTRTDCDIILSDIRMPERDGWELLDDVSQRSDPPVVIMMSAYGDRDTAREVMRRGAWDYVSKPFDTDQLLLTLCQAGAREKLRRENQKLREEVLKEYSFDNIIAQSPQMLEIFAVIRKISEYKTTVLITGESGTGKELIAREVHFSSPRRDNPFVAINCGAIPTNLLESELFGHVRGSFTDAIRDKIGLFEMADTGTLFLDEIGEMPLELQVKLLRVLQEEEIRRIGGSQPTPVDVRIVAATVKDLRAEVVEGRFREDLFYRLNVLAIHLPPLRERKEDVPILFEHFLEKYSNKHGVPSPKITKAAVALLMNHRWPGNVRELENAMERAIILSDDEITPESLPPDVLAPRATFSGADDLTGDQHLSLKPRVRKLEEQLIRRALELSHANRKRAAKVLDISHRSLLYKMQEYGIK